MTTNLNLKPDIRLSVNQTFGFDNNKNRINELISGNDRTLEISNSIINTSSIKFTSTVEDIIDCNIYIVTVPTPVDKKNDPDFSEWYYEGLNIPPNKGKLLKKYTEYYHLEENWNG